MSGLYINSTLLANGGGLTELMKRASGLTVEDRDWVLNHFHSGTVGKFHGIINMVGPDRNTALHFALNDMCGAQSEIQHNKACIAHTLIQGGADVFMENVFGKKATDYLTPSVAKKFLLPYSGKFSRAIKGICRLPYILG